jgi:cytidyltransferase-like protein
LSKVFLHGVNRKIKIKKMENKKNKKVVVVSGYFNPLHVGHLNMIKSAKELGDYLVVIVNSDHQVGLKGSVPFQDEKDRVEIIRSLKWVDEAFLSIDKDRSVCESLRKINPDIFANGGDRNNRNIPEDKVCCELNIKMIENVGGDKIQSSSILIKRAQEKKYEKQS